MKFLVFLSVFLLFPLSEAQASCGLDHCKVLSKDKSKDISVENLFRFTNQADEQFDYVENFFGLYLRLSSYLSLGLSMPLVVILDGETGLGNSVASLEYELFSKDDLAASLGLQLEIPTAMKSLPADSHFLALPYLSVQKDLNEFAFELKAGLSQTLDSHDHSADSLHGADGHNHAHGHSHESAAMINPHAKSEILYRLGAAYSLAAGTADLSFLVGVDGINELSDSENFLLSSLSGINYQDNWGDLELNLFFPVTQEKRFDWKMSLSLNLHFAS